MRFLLITPAIVLFWFILRWANRERAMHRPLIIALAVLCLVTLPLGYFMTPPGTEPAGEALASRQNLGHLAANPFHPRSAANRPTTPSLAVNPSTISNPDAHPMDAPALPEEGAPSVPDPRPPSVPGAINRSFISAIPKIIIARISPAVTLSPEFQIRRTNPKLAESRKWLEIEVEFALALPEGADQFDEVTFEYLVKINQRLFSGEITHVNISRGPHHFSVMFLAPRDLAWANGGQPFTQASIGNLWISAKRHGLELGRRALHGADFPNPRAAAGLLLPKSATPFSLLWWDRYEDVSPHPSDFRSADSSPLTSAAATDTPRRAPSR